MDYITENLKTEIKGNYDLIVVGGGPAGCAAAITAGRAGLKVLLVERYGFLGGTWTAALVTPFFDAANKGGLVREIVNDLKAKDAFGAFWNISFDFETLKQLLDDKVQQAGVEVLFHTYFCEPVMEEKTVCGVIVQNKGGRAAYLSKYVLDCTGDGDVAVRAGAEYVYGDGENAQDMTTMFLMSNVKYRQQKPDELVNLMKKACAEHDTGYNIDFDKPYVIALPPGNLAVVQLVHIRGKNGVDPKQLSEAEMLGRKKAMEAFNLFKKYIPEFKDAELICTAPQIGVRESRHIIGEYVLTADDLINGAEFPDGGDFKVCFNVDIHNGEEQDCRQVKPYQIPLRALKPKGLKGILTAGRCISGDYIAHASYRVTGDCVAMGEMAANAVVDMLK